MKRSLVTFLNSKVSSLIIAFTVLSMSQVCAQLTGTALLSNQSNHSGIKVRFIANSGTAVSDSVLTDASGNYSVNISGDVYYVQMQKNGYQTVYYNNNSTVLLTNTTVVNTVTLYPGNLVYVTGTVSGNWTNNNIYIVNSDIQIPSGSTLNIQPGTTIKANGLYTITANGVLNADASNGNPIVFTSNLTNPSIPAWNGLMINSSSSKIINCLIEYGFNGVRCDNSSPTISGNEIRKFYAEGVYSSGSAAITGNKIHDFFTLDISMGINAMGNEFVSCNEVYDGNGYGIRPTSSATVINNVVKNIIYSSRGFGIGATYGSPRIENNIISGCVKGLVLSKGVNSPGATAINNTIYNNTDGIMLGWAGDCYSNSVIMNNIITNNVNGITQDPTCSNATPSSIGYNCVWNNTTNYNNVPVTGLGQVVSTNSNGDPIDSYYDISLNPLYLGGVPPKLAAGSPCMNAGNSAYSNNIGCNTALICSNIVLAIHEKNNTAGFLVYPNPFSDVIFVKAADNTSSIKVEIFNAFGELMQVAILSPGKSHIDLTGVTPGVYLLRFDSDRNSGYTKIIKR